MSIVAIVGSTFTYYLPGLEDQANPGLFKAAPTIAAGDFTISTNGGAFEAMDNTPTVKPTGGTQIEIVLSATETTAAGAGGRITVNCQDAAGAEWYSVGLAIPVQAADVSTLGGTAQTGDSYAVVNHTDYGNAKLVRSTTPANTLDVSATGEAGLDFDNVKAASAPTTLTNITVPVVTTLTNMPAAAPTAAAISDAVWDELLSGHEIGGSAGNALSAAGAAGDPWGVTLPGSYASDEAGGIIGMLAGIDTSAVTVTSTNDAGVLTITRGVTFAATVSGLTISGTWAKLYFTLKESDYDDDEDAIVQIVETNPAALTDGLLYLDSAAIVSPITIADGTLTVNQVAGTVAIAITDNATVKLAKASGLVWDIKTKDTGGATVENATGTASIVRAITQTI